MLCRRTNVFKILPRLLFALTLLFVSCSAPRIQPPITPPTIEQKATHMVVFLRGTREVGECTATAIGPHALLTASHCNKDEKLTKIHLDLVMNDYRIQKTLTDGRDHDIYLIDGPSLNNFVDYKVRPAKEFERVHLYGDGEGTYPPRRLDGVKLPFYDFSEIDQSQGIVHFSMGVIPGDSGSAVIGDDGSIVAVTTYLWKEHEDDKHGTTVDFLPAFTEDQITEAFTFAPSLVPYVEAVAPPRVHPPNLLDLFDPFGMR